jgi:hypothetical protein
MIGQNLDDELGTSIWFIAIICKSIMVIMLDNGNKFSTNGVDGSQTVCCYGDAISVNDIIGMLL